MSWNRVERVRVRLGLIGAGGWVRGKLVKSLSEGGR